MGRPKKQAEQLFQRIGEAVVANSASNGGAGLGGLDLLPLQGENSKDIQTLLHQVVDENRMCSLKVHRKPTVGRPVFLGFINDIPPKELVSGGVEEAIRRVFGGGEFVIDLLADGIAKPLAKGLVYHIAGTSNYLPGESQSGIHSAGLGGNVMQLPVQQAPPWAVAGQPMSTSWKAVKGGPSGADDLMETMRQTLLLKAAASQSDPKTNEQIDMLKAQLAEMREQGRRTEEAMREERRQSEMRTYMEQSNRRFEELAKMVSEANRPKESTNWKEVIPVIVAAASPVLSAVLNKGDGMAQMVNTVLQNQNASSSNQTEMLKIFMNRPSAEERMGTMIGNIAELMNAQFSTVSQVLQSGLFDKGGEHPAVQLISQALDAGREIAGNIFTNMREASQEGEEQESEVLAGLQPPQAVRPVLGAPTAPQDDNLLTSYEGDEVYEEGDEELEDDQDETLEPVDENSDSVKQSTEVEPQEQQISTDSQMESFDMSKDPAFGAIIEKIRQDGWLQEIAMRIWRHAGGDNPEHGHPVARQWWDRPADMTKIILSQLDVPQDRIVAVADAIASVKLYGRNNNLNDLALKSIPGLKKRTEKAEKAETRKTVPPVAPR